MVTKHPPNHGLGNPGKESRPSRYLRVVSHLIRWTAIGREPFTAVRARSGHPGGSARTQHPTCDPSKPSSRSNSSPAMQTISIRDGRCVPGRCQEIFGWGFSSSWPPPLFKQWAACQARCQSCLSPGNRIHIDLILTATCSLMQLYPM